MKSVTVKQVMAWKPCGWYTQRRIERLFKGRLRLTPLNVCNLKISSHDKILALSRMMTAAERRRIYKAVTGSALKDSSQVAFWYLTVGWDNDVVKYMRKLVS